jgi:hypothetical protein
MQLATLQARYHHPGPSVRSAGSSEEALWSVEVSVVPEAQGKGGGVAALLRWDDQPRPSETV